MRSNPLPRFALGVLIIMPLCLGVWWFWLREILVMLLHIFVSLSAKLLYPEEVIGLIAQRDAQSGSTYWLLRTSLSPISDPRQLVAIPISTTRFTISYPLFWGLVLATPRANRGEQLVWGTCVLIPLTILIAVLLVQFKLALHINQQPILTEFPRGDYVLALPYQDYVYYLMAVGRQLSMLVLPTLVPLLTWGFFNRQFIRDLVYRGLLGRDPEQTTSQQAHS